MSDQMSGDPFEHMVDEGYPDIYRSRAGYHYSDETDNFSDAFATTELAEAAMEDYIAWLEGKPIPSQVKDGALPYQPVTITEVLAKGVLN